MPEQNELLIQCWKNHISKIVPDPSTSYKSDYKPFANWLKVVKELNTADYNSLLDDWKVRHKSRRNLWKELNL